MKTKNSKVNVNSRNCSIFVAFILINCLFGCGFKNLLSKDNSKKEIIENKVFIKQKNDQNKLFGIINVYRADIQQGNFISKEMVSQLEVGMSPEQIIFILGTPLIEDIFNDKRWDYLFTLKRGDGQFTTSHLEINFKKGVLLNYKVTDLPEEKEYLQQISNPKKK
tara:strand:+ start:2535 stop:3029 length:495 start_codon:yes stop_codon:yes gene_type:complete